MRGLPRIVMNRRILQRVWRDVVDHPQVEIGGRWIGHHLSPTDSSYADIFDGQTSGEAFVILDYIPTGPNPERSTAIELQPDRRYQLWTLRKLIEEDERIEVLGSWHSHIPNGMDRFSRVDHESYHSKINNPSSPLPFSGIVCSLIHQNPATEEEVLDKLEHAWFPVGSELGEHEWFAPEAITWKDLEVPASHLLDLEDHSHYLLDAGTQELEIDDWIRAIDRVASRWGVSEHQLRIHPSGNRIILIESMPDGTDYAVEISSSGDASFHEKGAEGDWEMPMSSVEDAMSILEERVTQSGAMSAPWSHVNSTLASSLRIKERGVFQGFIARILGLD